MDVFVVLRKSKEASGKGEWKKGRTERTGDPEHIGLLMPCICHGLYSGRIGKRF